MSTITQHITTMVEAIYKSEIETKVEITAPQGYKLPRYFKHNISKLIGLDYQVIKDNRFTTSINFNYKLFKNLTYSKYHTLISIQNKQIIYR